MPRRLAQQGETGETEMMDEFRLEAQLLAEGLPSVEKFQAALVNAYERGLRQGGKKALQAIRSDFRLSGADIENETEDRSA